MLLRGFSILLLACLSLTAQVPRPENGGHSSLEKEAALGKQLAAEIRRRTTAIDNPVVQKYLDQLGRKLGSQMPNKRFPFTFSVVAEDLCRSAHEPAALPGGYVFVPSALFLAAQDEAEFAGMLAHAMEHTTPRPAASGPIVNGASIPLIFFGQWSGGCSGRETTPQAFARAQRNAELDADSLAVGAMARAGFDPQALVRYIERVPAASSDRDGRVAALLSAIEKLPLAGHSAAPSDEFTAAQQEMRRIVQPPVRSEARPSLVREKRYQ